MMKDRLNVGKSLADVSLIMAGAMFIAFSFYHPYYFGDELTSFFRHPRERTFLNIFGDFNSYKPRLVFNAIWALYGDFSAPRYVPMVVNAICLGGAASVLYFIGRNRYDASRGTSILIAIIFLTSRFGMMLHFDYLSGNIETLSALLFFSAIYYLLGFIGADYGEPVHLLYIFALSCLMVFVHERYIVATFVMGSLLVVSSFKEKTGRYSRIVCGVSVFLLPFIMFFLAGNIFSSMSISTGTAGRSIDVGVQTGLIAIRYFGNVLLGLNFGSPWFVGSLNVSNGVGVSVIPVLTVSLFFAWMGVLLFKRKGTNWPRIFMMLGLIASLIVVAALPGPDKQESRWMFPVAGLLSLLVISVSRGRTANVLLSIYLVVNAVYFFTGSYREIFNVQASSEAGSFGDSFSKVEWNGKAGLILDAPEPQASWWLGGDTILGNDGKSGLIFCRVNFEIDSACIFPPSSGEGDAERFEFGFRFTPGSGGNTDGPDYTYVDKATLIAAEKLDQAITRAAVEGYSSQAGALNATPSVIDLCKDSSAKENIAVHWSVTDPEVQAVTVWLVSSKGGPALFSTGGPVGVAETGEWVTSEVSFVLTDSETERVLAAAKVQNKVCD